MLTPVPTGNFRRVLRRTAIFIGLIVIISLVRFPFESLDTRVRKRFERAATSAGLSLQIDRVSFDFPIALKLNGVGVSFPTRGIPTPLALEELRLRPEVLRSLLLEFAISGTFRAYRGTGEVISSRSFFSPTIRFSGSGDGFDLSLHPILSAIGVSGILSVDLRAEVSKDFGTRIIVDNGELTVSIRDGNYAGGHTVAGILPLPRLTGATFDVRLVQEGSRIRVHDLLFTSSVGSLTGKGMLGIDAAGKPSTVELDLSLRLTHDGRKTFGPFLSMFSRGQTSARENEWRLSLRGPIAFPTITALPLSRGGVSVEG